MAAEPLTTTTTTLSALSLSPSSSVFSPDILRCTFSYLPGSPALAISSLVDKDWKAASEHEELWRSHLLVSYGEEMSTVLDAFPAAAANADPGGGSGGAAVAPINNQQPRSPARDLFAALHRARRMGDSDDEADGDGGGDLEEWQQLPPGTPKETRTNLIRARLRHTFLLIQIRTKQGELLAHKAFSLADVGTLAAFFFDGESVGLTLSERIKKEVKDDMFHWKQTLYLIEVGSQGDGGGGCRVAKVMEKQNRPMYKPAGECEWFSCVGDDRLYRPTPAPAGKLYQNDRRLAAGRETVQGASGGKPVVQWMLRLGFTAFKIHQMTWKSKVEINDSHQLYKDVAASVKNIKEWA